MTKSKLHGALQIILCRISHTKVKVVFVGSSGVGSAPVNGIEDLLFHLCYRITVEDSDVMSNPQIQIDNDRQRLQKRQEY